MKNKKKILAIALAAVLLVSASVFTTMAFLSDQTENVVNTFTVGKVDIDLDESLVDANGKILEGEDAARTQENSYKLIPGKSYDKDPVVTVKQGSETSWVFVTVEELDQAGKFLDYKVNNAVWTKLEGEDNVYFCKVDANTDADELLYVLAGAEGHVNGKIIAKSDIENGSLDNLNPRLQFKAYAIQAEGFETPQLAWAELKPVVQP